ncbi:MAG TPA: glycoside hydrolase family 97 N-terminal domain-containing protein, partial [Chitinophagaceae bacterium]|nr:glycoside hydrolase family 97 N-terminal domain-containing protein [Chitinophagaceae bacterium]
MLLQRLLTTCVLLCIISISHSQTFTVKSPSKTIRLDAKLMDNGQLTYSVSFNDKTVTGASSLGFKLKTPADRLLNSFNLVNADSARVDQTWKPVWGEESSIRNNYRELRLQLSDRNKTGLLLTLVFRVFDDGLGFRYEFPKQDSLNHFIVDEELTQFAMSGDHKAFWIPGDYDTNEFTYYTSSLSKVDASGGGLAQEIHAKTFFSKDAVQTPLMMKSADGLYINIHEAALVNYPAMDLLLNKSNYTFTSSLVPDAVGNKAYLQAPAKTPWRTIVVSDKAKDILQSRIILNLNEPTSLKDVSWIKPQKFVGVWWEMHVGKSSWDYSGSQVGSQQATKVPHGANTANVKRYIDFAAKYGFDGVLVEGWNTGWEDWFGQWKEDVFDFVTPYPDFNV